MALKYTIKNGKLYEIVDGEEVLKGSPNQTDLIDQLKKQFFKSREDRGIVGNDNPITGPVAETLEVKSAKVIKNKNSPRRTIGKKKNAGE